MYIYTDSILYIEKLCLYIDLVIAQVLWEGLWMNCLSQTTGHIQCKTYDSTLALPSSLQAARGLIVLSLLLSKCTHCMGDAKQALKARLASLGGVLFIVAGLAYLVPICWTAYAIISDFYDPNVAAPLKRELGPALYLGWGASIMLLVGGTLLHVGSSPTGVRGTPVLGSAAKDMRLLLCFYFIIERIQSQCARSSVGSWSDACLLTVQHNTSRTSRLVL
uniref:Claudin n=1 Tax=Gouania willdenowi TaxID=441366 RepID=A0A8C5NDN4_GOUWI